MVRIRKMSSWTDHMFPLSRDVWMSLFVNPHFSNTAMKTERAISTGNMRNGAALWHFTQWLWTFYKSIVFKANEELWSQDHLKLNYESWAVHEKRPINYWFNEVPLAWNIKPDLRGLSHICQPLVHVSIVWVLLYELLYYNRIWSYISSVFYIMSSGCCSYCN